MFSLGLSQLSPAECKTLARTTFLGAAARWQWWSRYVMAWHLQEFSPVSQPQTCMVRVPVELSEGGPLSTTRMGRKYTFCSWRLKPVRFVRIPAVLSEREMDKQRLYEWVGVRLAEQISWYIVVVEQRNRLHKGSNTILPVPRLNTWLKNTRKRKIGLSSLISGWVILSWTHLDCASHIFTYLFFKPSP